VLDELAVADAAVGACVDSAVWALPESALVAAVEAVHALEQRLAAVKLALIREVDGRGVAVAHGASSTAVWVRERLRLSIPAARRLVDLAAAVDAGPPALREALSAGAVTVEQARVITDTAATVSEQAGSAAADKAVGMLLKSAGRFEPTLLRRLGSRILQHVAPDVAERADRAAVEAEAAYAERHRQLTWCALSDGRVRLTGSLDAETGALLQAAIEPLTGPAGPGDTRSPAQRRHDALAEVCRLVLRCGELPDAGGDAAQVVVTVGFDVVAGRLGAGTLDTGLRLAPETVRRLACDAAILPAVLGGQGQVLDVGRQRRLITGPLRRALVLRDRGCAFPGCDRPPRWAEGHHIRHWSDGGSTSLENAVLLCRHHHRRVHHHDWFVRIGGDGHPEFLPPAWLDADRQPRRNQYHRRN
jgi:Domain of unknown function (DUF222)/HNH endonuclease